MRICCAFIFVNAYIPITPQSDKKKRGKHMDVPSRLISVGRLDQESEGLLLLTNSGSLSRTLELPANGFVRKYLVKTTGVNVRVNVCVCVCVPVLHGYGT
jgi:16S rRNA U516 pseudouridylate synthase RsuA-like enzyme